MSISFTNGCPGGSSTNSNTASTGSGSVAANTIVAFAAALASTPANNPVTGFSDSGGNTYSAPTFLGVDLNGFGLWYATAVGATTGAGVTVTVTTASSSPAITIVAAGYNITVPQPMAANSGTLITGTGSSVQSTPCGATSFAEVVIGLISGAPKSTALSPGPGFTAASSFTSAGINAALLLEHQIVSTTGNYAAPAILSPQGNWAAFAVALADNATPARSSQTVGALALGASGGPIPIPGIPPNMSVLAAMSAGLLPANVVVTGSSAIVPSPALTLLHQLTVSPAAQSALVGSKLLQPNSQLASSAGNQLQVGTPPIFGG